MKAPMIVVVTAMLASAPAAMAEPVTLTVKIAPVVVLPDGQENATVPVTLTLANASNQAVTLQASNNCEIHIWKVTDSKGTVVTDHGICMMIYQPQSDTLAPGAHQTADAGISLHAADYRAGETYTLDYRFWNISAEAKFAVKRAPKAN
ncbi:MAG: hypothetical protein KGM97_00365 [Alphaproteobacteria bacterium]|nr:hypothetical protein [Alphaproteobacteria bacterium]MDE2629417.1 hypothetical protein [Alphaproteobacteria bacterium]